MRKFYRTYLRADVGFRLQRMLCGLEPPSRKAQVLFIKEGQRRESKSIHYLIRRPSRTLDPRRRELVEVEIEQSRPGEGVPAPVAIA